MKPYDNWDIKFSVGLDKYMYMTYYAEVIDFYGSGDNLEVQGETLEELLEGLDRVLRDNAPEPISWENR